LTEEEAPLLSSTNNRNTAESPSGDSAGTIPEMEPLAAAWRLIEFSGSINADDEEKASRLFLRPSMG
jgi:hypothetical protein